MKQYIEKDRILAEIKKKKIPFKKDIDDGVYPTYLCALMDFEDFIDTFEMKEVDLDKEVANWWKDHYKKIKNDYKFEDYNGHYMENSTIISLAQYFFELGLKAKGE